MVKDTLIKMHCLTCRFDITALRFCSENIGLNDEGLILRGKIWVKDNFWDPVTPPSFRRDDYFAIKTPCPPFTSYLQKIRSRSCGELYTNIAAVTLLSSPNIYNDIFTFSPSITIVPFSFSSPYPLTIISVNSSNVSIIFVSNTLISFLFHF